MYDMASPISDEELQLRKRARRRLVGAIVLVTAVAVILPMVLDSQPKPVSSNVDIQIPSPEAPQFKGKSAAAPAADAKAGRDGAEKSAKADAAPNPAPSSSPGSASRASTGDAKSVVADASPSSAKDSGKAAARDAGKDSAKDAAKDSKDSTKDSGKETAQRAGSYFVQVAALASPAKAKEVQKQVSRTGVKTYTEVVSTDNGEMTRVRAGPYPTKEAAERVRAQLRKAGFKETVVQK